MASRSNELPTLYGHAARDINRVDAGYRPRPSDYDRKPSRFETFFLSVLSKILPITTDDHLTFRQPKGDPDSYEVNNWL